MKRASSRLAAAVVAVVLAMLPLSGVGMALVGQESSDPLPLDPTDPVSQINPSPSPSPSASASPSPSPSASPRPTPTPTQEPDSSSEIKTEEAGASSTSSSYDRNQDSASAAPDFDLGIETLGPDAQGQTPVPYLDTWLTDSTAKTQALEERVDATDLTPESASPWTRAAHRAMERTSQVFASTPNATSGWLGVALLAGLIFNARRKRRLQLTPAVTPDCLDPIATGLLASRPHPTPTSNRPSAPSPKELHADR